MKLREYQVEALNAIHNRIKHHKKALLSAATGAGKTVILCRLINKYFFKFPNRTFLILAHKQELLEQFYNTFGWATDIPKSDIDICCSGIKKKCNMESRVILASVQTIINKMNIYSGADLVCVDETHRISHDEESQYKTLLNTLREYKPNHRVIGVTATTYRLGHGKIYGDYCRPGRVNFFPELTHKIAYKRLVSEGHLMPLVGKVSAGEKVLTELNGVKLTGGDYTMSDAGGVMGRHVESAVKAYEEHAKHHKKVAVLACTIEHAELLTEAFSNYGYNAAPVHSKLNKADRKGILHEWRHGDIDIVVSVNVLIEGFDMPELSCLIMCRPTKSPVIWVQSIGRILRKAEGKEEALLIDMVGNVREFGLDLDNPKFIVPQSKDGEDGEAPMKICPGDLPDGTACGATLFAAVLICPDCGYKYDKEEVQKELGDMDDIEFKQLEPPKWYDVISMEPSIHNSKKNRNKLLRISLSVQPPDDPYGPTHFVSVWCCFEDFYSDNDYALEMGEEKWCLFSDQPYPASVEEAEWNFDSIATPARVLCEEDDNGYLSALEFDFDTTAPGISDDDVPF